MTADTVGGVWTFALELAQALAAHGVETGLATLAAPLDPGQRAAALAVPGLRLFEGGWRVEWMADPWEHVRRSGQWLLELESRFAPDRVHLNGYAHGALPWRTPVVVTGHSCVLSWWRAVRGGEAPAEWDAYRHAVRAGLAGADHVVAPSRAMLDSLERDYGPLPGASVVPNGRDPSPFRVRTVRDPLVLGVGRVWDEAKNLAALDRVAAQLPWTVVIAGETRHPDGGGVRGLRHARALGALPPRALADLYGRAAITALPARYEPFGLCALEAALAGSALVLGDLPSQREIWGEAAIYVPPDDDEALAGAILRLIDERARRREMAARARERALQHGLDRMAEGYLEAYRRARDARAGTAPDDGRAHAESRGAPSPAGRS